MRESSGTAQRYIHHQREHSNILLFVRRRKKDGSRTNPYTFLGAADYVEHQGELPIAFTWRLRRSISADFYHQAKVATA
jgi:hypothetical protein